MHYHKGVPSTINKKFRQRKVDAAFISSIEAQKCKNAHLGIIAKKEVQSVLVIPSQKTKKDSESATSNRLAELLGISGEILIGDKALRYALDHDNYIDLAKMWYERYNLPFVFALLCSHSKKKEFLKLQKSFAKHSHCIKIPHYLLQKASKRTQIEPKAIKSYLKLISYKMDYKAKRSFVKFYMLVKIKQNRL